MSHAMTLRRRRKLLTPVTGGLTALIVAAGGFIGGVQVQKHQGTSTATGGSFPQGAPGGQQAASDATTGTVSSVDGDVLYVKDASGTTVKVKVKSSADVTRTASTDAAKVKPGDTVTVQGAANRKGTVTATSVVASGGTAR
jgi:hypothetical protein